MWRSIADGEGGAIAGKVDKVIRGGARSDKGGCNGVVRQVWPVSGPSVSDWHDARADQQIDGPSAPGQNGTVQVCRREGIQEKQPPCFNKKRAVCDEVGEMFCAECNE